MSRPEPVPDLYRDDRPRRASTRPSTESALLVSSLALVLVSITLLADYRWTLLTAGTLGLAVLIWRRVPLRQR